MRRTGGGSAPCTIQSPRAIGFLPSMPARLSARRCPARPARAGALWAWIERTRAAAPASSARTSPPAATSPLIAVPVTTSPAPAMVKQRSTLMRKLPRAARTAVARAAASRCARRAARFSPVAEETANTGEPASAVPSSSAPISAAASRARSAGTRSILVSATAPRATPSRSRIERCSRVCGIGPSSAATTSSARSIPATPASMLCTKRSWPGTSTKPIVPASPGR
ncbi:MAG TPA: hypothetical protein VMI15_01235 [Burkholderiales bacterium]|nr:hypothetical protein [Burkholderiales bacterium]